MPPLDPPRPLTVNLTVIHSKGSYTLNLDTVELSFPSCKVVSTSSNTVA